tara:strand:+ start:5654 stop:5872 length:219 start_codon:yes stop_codon:yes gene_type:complete
MKEYKPYILKNTTTKAINLPSEVWKEAGWELNDDVEVVCCQVSVSHNKSYNSISIDRVKDLKKYEKELYEEK